MTVKQTAHVYIYDFRSGVLCSQYRQKRFSRARTHIRPGKRRVVGRLFVLIMRDDVCECSVTTACYLWIRLVQKCASSQDKTGKNKTRQDKTRQDMTRQDKTTQHDTTQHTTRHAKIGKTTRQDKDKTRQDNTRRDNTPSGD